MRDLLFDYCPYCGAIIWECKEQMCCDKCDDGELLKDAVLVTRMRYSG